MSIRAIAFDTGGTVLDWHRGLSNAFSEVGERHNLALDWGALVNEWRRNAMKGIVGQVRPDFNMDDVHWESLQGVLERHELKMFSDEDRKWIHSAWYRLDAWSDFGGSQAALRKSLPVVSFTMLPTALVMSVSRRNNITWDSVISCEMTRVYKPHLAAYETAAKWIGVAPAEVLMVACHNFDLNAAKKAGFRTAFVRRPDEWGPSGHPDPEPNMNYDLVVDGFDALSDRVAQLLGS